MGSSSFAGMWEIWIRVKNRSGSSAYRTVLEKMVGEVGLCLGKKLRPARASPLKYACTARGERPIRRTCLNNACLGPIKLCGFHKGLRSPEWGWVAWTRFPTPSFP